MVSLLSGVQEIIRMIRKIMCGVGALCLAMVLTTAARADAGKTMVVAADGSGQYKTVQSAIDAIPAGKDPVTIHILPGTYTEQITIAEDKPPIRMYGDDANTTILTFNLNAKMKDADGVALGSLKTPSTTVLSNDFEADDITFANSTPGQVAQALAIRISGDREIFRRCRFLGWQDTVYTNGKSDEDAANQPSATTNPSPTTWPTDPAALAAAQPAANRIYFEDSYIEGGVDYLFGNSTAVIRNCELHAKQKGSITTASTPQGVAYGYVFMNCKLTASDEVDDGKVFLGRPGKGCPNVIYMNCDMASEISPAGWSIWKKAPDRIKSALFAEYQSTGAGASPDTRMQYGHQLSDAEAKAITIQSVLAGADNWDPKPTAEPTSQPATH
jgi:pectinesterase